jgi:hypothetical protein
MKSLSRHIFQLSVLSVIWPVSQHHSNAVSNVMRPVLIICSNAVAREALG